MTDSPSQSKLGTIVGGFFILLPFILAYLMIGQLFDMLMALTQPVFDLLPGVFIKDEPGRRAVSALLLILIFLFVGQFAHTRMAQRFGGWFEANLLNKFPPYVVIKSLSARLAGIEKDAQLQPAMMTVAPDTRMIVAVVEELPGGYASVLVPLAPTPGLGFLQIVKADKLERLECSMADALGWILNWGADTKSLFPNGMPTGPGPSPPSAG